MGDELAVDWSTAAARVGAIRTARDSEMRLRRFQAAKAAETPADKAIAWVGRYLFRSRGWAGISQEVLAHRAGVSQSMVSRAERGLARAMPFERFISLTRPLDRLFPLGCCPHDHDCPWQPFREPQQEISSDSLYVERMLKFAGEE